MIVNIVKSSRCMLTSGALSRALGLGGGSGSGGNSSQGSSSRSSPSRGEEFRPVQALETARAALRNFKLDINPVYKPS